MASGQPLDQRSRPSGEVPVPDMTSPGAAATPAQPRLILNPVIEQAKGILMAQLGCTPDQAFDLLRRASQRANVKVSVLAAQLIDQVVSAQVPKTPGIAAC